MGLLLPASRALVGEVNFTLDAQFSSATGTLITASATPHTLGTITEIIASTTHECDWIEIGLHGVATSATLTDALLNIYIGAGGSETLLIDSLSAGWSPALTSGNPNRYWFPLRIPRGTRISAALRGLIASETSEVVVALGRSNGAHWSGTGVETLGEVTASSRGTAVTPATAAPTWASIGTSGRTYKYIVLGIQGNNDTTATSAHLLWSVGTGSAVLQNLGWFDSFISASEYHCWGVVGDWCDIASGTALQLRAWANTAPSGAVYATIHGVY
jgi:hypothetical protein